MFLWRWDRGRRRFLGANIVAILTRRRTEKNLLLVKMEKLDLELFHQVLQLARQFGQAVGALLNLATSIFHQG